MKIQLEDKVSVFESRIDSSRFMAEQEIEDANSQVKELTEALTAANA